MSTNTFRTTLALFIAVAAFSTPAAAQTGAGCAACADTIRVPATDAGPSITATVVREAPPLAPRPTFLLGMYVASGALHSYDAYSTLKGISGNAVEANPFMRAMVKQPGVFIAAKGVMALATMAAAEQMWRSHHPGRAIALMVISNVAMSAVAVRNAGVLRGQR